MEFIPCLCSSKVSVDVCHGPRLILLLLAMGITVVVHYWFSGFDIDYTETAHTNYNCYIQGEYAIERRLSPQGNLISVEYAFTAKVGATVQRSNTVEN